VNSATATLFSLAFSIFFNPTHLKKSVSFLAENSHHINGINIKKNNCNMLLTIFESKISIINLHKFDFYAFYSI